MLRMRLQRRGKKNYATYRVVVAERGVAVKGRTVADLGHYSPHTDAFVVETEIVQQWLAKGVQPSATVHNLLVQHGILKAEKVTSWKPKRKEGEAPTSAEASVGKSAGEERKADETTTKPVETDKKAA